MFSLWAEATRMLTLIKSYGEEPYAYKFVESEEELIHSTSFRLEQTREYLVYIGSGGKTGQYPELGTREDLLIKALPDSSESAEEDKAVLEQFMALAERLKHLILQLKRLFDGEVMSFLELKELEAYYNNLASLCSQATGSPGCTTKHINKASV